MDYRFKYEALDNAELAKVLGRSKELNFEAQKGLKSVIEARDKNEFEQRQIEELDQLIDAELKRIDDCSYFSNLGFKFSDEEQLSLTRSTGAKAFDVFTFVVGLILSFALVPFVQIIMELSNGEPIGILPVISIVIDLVIITYGILLMARSLIRMLNYWNFKIEKRDGNITIVKDGVHVFSTAEIASRLHYITEEKTAQLAFSLEENGPRIPLIETNGGTELKTTLRLFRQKLISPTS